MAAWNPRANEIFADALELPAPADRGALLDRACGGDAELRRQVEALLAAHARAGSFLAAPVADPSTRTHNGPAGPQPTADLAGPAEDVGTRVGPYRLLQKLGEGGMGTVWVAEQSEPVRRRVALKVIKPGMDSERVLARFEAERQALALMDHTNIAKVFDAGTTPAGRPYFAMELVKGVPITTYCDELHLSIRDRLSLFVQVCRAVQHAHQKGVIHRDLKPSNVLVAIEDGKPVPKVIDFGVAKALHAKLTERTLYTEIGAVVGTLEYMAPEQAELSPLDVDTRADVYALGALLYELLTGTTPITHDRLKTVGFAEVLRLIKEEEPTPPSTLLSRSREALAGLAAKRRTDPGWLAWEVRGELDWIVMKALEKDRTRRYDTANGLVRDIERFLADEPVEACPPSAGYRVRKFLRRNRPAVLAGGLVLLVLVAGVVGTTLGLLEARQQRDEAVRARFEELRLQGQEKHLRDVAESRREAAERAEGEARRRFTEADQERRRARDERDAKQAALTRSDGLRLGAEAMLARSTDPGLALLLGLEAVRRYPHPLTFNALYDASADLRERRCLTSDASGLRYLRLSPDRARFLVGTEHALGSGPTAAAVHDAATGKKLAGWPGFGLGLADLDWSPDGTRAVAATVGRAVVAFTDGGKPERATFTDRVAYVWDAATGRDVAHLRGHEDYIVSCRFSPDGTKVLTASWDETARLWDAATGRELHVLRGHTRSLLTALFSPDGRRVLTVSAQATNSASYRDYEGKPRPVQDPNPDPGVQVRPYRVESSKNISGGSSAEPEGAFARLWDAETGRPVGTLAVARRVLGLLDATDNRPTTAAFSPDGRRVVVGFESGLVGVWDAGAAGTPLRTFGGGHRGRVTAAAFSPDGGRLVTAGGGKVFLWYMVPGADLSRVVPFELEGHGDAAVSSVRFSKDGGRFVTAAADKMARVWDGDSGRPVAVLRGHAGPVGAAEFLDPDTVVTAGDRTVRFWSVSPPAPVPTLLTGEPSPLFGTGPDRIPARVTALAFSPDGRTVVTGTSHYTAHLWDAETGRPAGAITDQLRGEVRHALFAPDGKAVYLGTSLNSVRSWDRGDKDTLLSMVHRWDLTTGKAARLLKDQTTGVDHMALSPDGRRLVVVGSQQGLVFRPTEANPLAHEWGGVVGTAGTAAVWDVETGQRVVTLLKPDTPRMDVSAQFSPDGRTVLLVDWERQHDLSIRDARTGAAVRALPWPRVNPFNRWVVAQFSPDGRTVAGRKSGGRDVWFWAADTGELLGSFRTPEDNPGWEGVGRFSPDSKWLAVGSDRVVHLVDVATRTGVRVFRGHEARVTALAFSPDGSRLLTGSDDRSAVLWDVATGGVLAVYKGHPGPVGLVAYSPDGRRVATASTDATARVWPVDLLPEFERRRPRELTPEERHRYELPAR